MIKKYEEFIKEKLENFYMQNSFYVIVDEDENWVLHNEASDGHYGGMARYYENGIKGDKHVQVTMISDIKDLKEDFSKFMFKDKKNAESTLEGLEYFQNTISYKGGSPEARDIPSIWVYGYLDIDKAQKLYNWSDERAEEERELSQYHDKEQEKKNRMDWDKRKSLVNYDDNYIEELMGSFLVTDIKLKLVEFQAGFQQPKEMYDL